MVLSDKTILEYLTDGGLEITPFESNNLGPNTVDLTLADECLIYLGKKPLDCKQPNKTTSLHSYKNLEDENHWVLQPGELYLFATAERVAINARNVCGTVCGKSSLGRLGMQIHMTAGFIDTGFIGNITLEVTVVKPLKIYAGMKICQIKFEKCTTSVNTTYPEKKGSKYLDQKGVQESLMHKNFADK